MKLKTISWVIGAAFAAPAFTQPVLAQENAPSTPAADAPTVVVTGMRASLRSAMNIKKNASEIVDSIAAEDIVSRPRSWQKTSSIAARRHAQH